MLPALEGEIQKRFDGRYVQAEHTLCEKAARWVDDHNAELSILDPQLPDGFYNRKADNWRPLFCIAGVLGGEWAQRLTVSALSLTGGDKGESVGIELLYDLRDLFTNRRASRLCSAEITEHLVTLEGRPWPEWGRMRKPITANAVARLLKPFGVRPKQIWFDGGNKNGYELESFAEVFSRFLEGGYSNH